MDIITKNMSDETLDRELVEVKFRLEQLQEHYKSLSDEYKHRHGEKSERVWEDWEIITYTQSRFDAKKFETAYPVNEYPMAYILKPDATAAKKILSGQEIEAVSTPIVAVKIQEKKD